MQTTPVQYLEVLRSRFISFRVLQHELKCRDMPSAQGWAPLFDKYSNPNAEDLATWSEGLSEIYTNSRFYGHKALTIYDVDVGVAEKISGLLEKLVAKRSPYKHAYPMPLEEGELRKQSWRPIPTKFVDDGNGNGRLICCAKRYFKAREVIEMEGLAEEARGALVGWDEIIGVREGHVQAFDSVIVRPDCREVLILLDLCSPMSSEDVLKARDYLANAINKLVHEELGLACVLGAPRNLFPYIQKLYDKSDGQVEDLGHATGTGSIKGERMRRHGTDLRTETFHQKGLEAVGHTNVYAITKTWQPATPRKVSLPSITIPGHFSLAMSPVPFIGYAIVDGSLNLDEFNMLLSKLK